MQPQRVPRAAIDRLPEVLSGRTPLHRPQPVTPGMALLHKKRFDDIARWLRSGVDGPSYLYSTICNSAFRLAAGVNSQRVAELCKDYATADTMPLVDFVVESALRRGVRLDRVALVGIQHLFGSTVGMIDGLNRLGLKYSNVYLGGKLYSTNAAAVHALRARGCVVVDPCEGTAISEWMQYQSESVHRRSTAEALVVEYSVRRSGADDVDAVCLLDDGAILIDLATSHPPPFGAVRVTAVEQTRRGADTLRGRALSFPVINVAESDSKLMFESTLIGQSIVTQTIDRVGWHGHDASNWHDVLVVGYGAVGRAVCDAFRQSGIRTCVWDSNPRALQRAQVAGERVADLSSALSAATVVVGCTGRSWYSRQLAAQRKRPERQFLASGSSSDLEFGPVLRLAMERRSAVNTHGALRSLMECIHEDVLQDHDGHSTLILNCGFPVNFDGEWDSIPAKYIQLTRALLSEGVIDSIESMRTGLIDLEPVGQSGIARHWMEHYHGTIQPQDKQESSRRIDSDYLAGLA